MTNLTNDHVHVDERNIRNPIRSLLQYICKYLMNADGELAFK